MKQPNIRLYHQSPEFAKAVRLMEISWLKLSDGFNRGFVFTRNADATNRFALASILPYEHPGYYRAFVDTRKPIFTLPTRRFQACPVDHTQGSAFYYPNYA